MSEKIFEQAAAWLDAGEPVAMATVVRIFGSSSQPLGARMAMTTGNRFVGAVSGGCVETDVYETAMLVLQRGTPLMLHYQQVENPLIGQTTEARSTLVEPLSAETLLLHAAREPLHRVNVTVCSPENPSAPDAATRGSRRWPPDPPLPDGVRDVWRCAATVRNRQL